MLHPRRAIRVLGFAASFWLLAGAPVSARGPANDIRVDADLSTKNARTEESALADVISDAVRAVDKSDAAFMHASAFTDTTVAKGVVSADAILKAVQYKDDTVVIVNLSGAQIRKALENGLRLYPQKSVEFLQVSGLTMSVDPAADKDKRVSSVKIGSGALDDNKKYKVAMPSPLANGGLGYYKIWDKATAIDHESTKTVGEAVTDYLSTHKTLAEKGDERIVFKK